MLPEMRCHAMILQSRPSFTRIETEMVRSGCAPSSLCTGLMRSTLRAGQCGVEAVQSASILACARCQWQARCCRDPCLMHRDHGVDAGRLSGQNGLSSTPTKVSHCNCAQRCNMR